MLILATALAFYAAYRYQPVTDGEYGGLFWFAGLPVPDSGSENGEGRSGPGSGGGLKNGDSRESDWIYEQNTVPSQPELPVSEGERQLLTKLYGFLETKDMVQAAALLNENQEQFKVLSDRTLEEEAWLFYVERTAQGEKLYRMRRMDEGVSGKGMVLTRFNTVFFGEFEEGAPNGSCLAVQTVILDYPRYTFADGIWKDGKMNGEGRTGYRYYAGKPEGNFEAVLKTGVYLENLMDGDLVYEADNGSGRVLHWNIKAEKGVTALDERWTYYSYSDEYMLRSEEDEDRAYVISGETKEQIRWNNLILWEN